jgi:hypothetical protein
VLDDGFLVEQGQFPKSLAALLGEGLHQAEQAVRQGPVFEFVEMGMVTERSEAIHDALL